MKFILSRKGCDSGTGKMASPIIVINGNKDGGKLLSLPIPVPVTEKQKRERETGISYDELVFGGKKLSAIIDELSNGNFDPNLQAHLDPDLDKERYPNHREKGWKPVFGQTNGPQTYLKNRGIVKGEDCLFLFFGWFRCTKKENNRLCYLKPIKPGEKGENLHVIFGWLQVGRIIPVEPHQPIGDFEEWLHYHPHIQNRDRNGYRKNNTIYVASKTLNIFGQPIYDKCGGGTFPHFKPSLQLTATDETMGHWCLPKWLYDNYIEGYWNCDKECCVPFDSVGNRQEFVFEVPEGNKEEAIDWLKELFDC